MRDPFATGLSPCFGTTRLGAAKSLLAFRSEPVSTKDDNRAIQTQSKAYRWLVKNAGRFGFRPYFYEPWHWEYVGK